jgi:hypothetical protein
MIQSGRRAGISQESRQSEEMQVFRLGSLSGRLRQALLAM